MTERFSIKCDIDESKSLHVFPGPSGLLCLQVKTGPSDHAKVFLENDNALEYLEALQDILGVEVDEKRTLERHFSPRVDAQTVERIEKLTKENSMLKAAETEQRRKIEGLMTRLAEAACTTPAAPEQPADPPPMWEGVPLEPCDRFPLGGFKNKNLVVYLQSNGVWLAVYRRKGWGFSEWNHFANRSAIASGRDAQYAIDSVMQWEDGEGT